MQIIMGRHLKKDKRGVSNIIVVVLSLIIIVVIVANVILWSYQMNQLDWEKIQENVTIENVVGGSSTFYTPSGYTLLGSTKLVSGSAGNLASNNGVYMTFRSYTSATSVTAKTDAFIAYRSNTGTSLLNSPKNRGWDGDSVAWSTENGMSTAASSVRFVRVAYCPLEQRSFEKIVVTLSDDGYLDAYVWDGTDWVVTNDIAFTDNDALTNKVYNYKCFDIAYEKTSGRALLVYSRGATTNEIGYKTWTFGTGWSSENLLELSYTTGAVNWIALASKPTSGFDEIAMIYVDQNIDVHGYVWTGSWSLMGATAVWDASAAIATEECIAVAYEQTSGRAIFIWADAITTDFYYRTWNGVTLTGPTLLDIAAAGAVGNWVTLKSNLINNELMFLVVDGASDLNTAYWSGSAWTVHTEHDGTVSTHAQRCADFDWEPTGSKGLLVWGTTAGYIAYRTFTAPNTWGMQQNPAMGANAHLWVQLRTNPRSISGDVKILGAIIEGNVFDIGAIRWDGTTFTVIGTNTISSDTTVVTYECFEMEFSFFGDPTEFTSEVEFTGTSNTEAWTQLTWIIDSAWTTGTVSVTLQLYDYNLGAYPTSGDGHISYTSSATPNMDETKSQTITVNPTHFRDSSSNWRVKITGVKSTSESFDSKVDWIKFEPTIVTCFTFKNKGASTSHIVSLWIINSTDHQRYSIDIFLNSGQTLSYPRADIRLPNGQYVVKIVTDRGNAAVYSED